jgi:hypothetical protein
VRFEVPESEGFFRPVSHAEAASSGAGPLPTCRGRQECLDEFGTPLALRSNRRPPRFLLLTRSKLGRGGGRGLEEGRWIMILTVAIRGNISGMGPANWSIAAPARADGKGAAFTLGNSNRGGLLVYGSALRSPLWGAPTGISRDGYLSRAAELP